MYSLEKLEIDLNTLTSEYAESTIHLSALLKVKPIFMGVLQGYYVCPWCRARLKEDDMKSGEHIEECVWKSAENFMLKLERKYRARRR